MWQKFGNKTRMVEDFYIFVQEIVADSSPYEYYIYIYIYIYIYFFFFFFFFFFFKKRSDILCKTKTHHGS